MCNEAAKVMLALDKARIGLSEAKDALGAVRVAVREVGPRALPRR